MLAPLDRWELESRQGAWCSTWSRAQLRHFRSVIPPKQQFPKYGPETSISLEILRKENVQALSQTNDKAQWVEPGSWF